MTSDIMKRETLAIHTHTLTGKTSCEDALRLGWWFCKPRNGSPKFARKPLKTRREASFSPSQPSEKNQACSHLNFRLLASRTMRWQIASAEATWFVELCYRILSKLICTHLCLQYYIIKGNCCSIGTDL